MADANIGVPDDATTRSGDLDFVNQSQVRADIGDLIFSPSPAPLGSAAPSPSASATALLLEGVTPGTVVGPITTDAGSEIFLVRALFPGALDERSRAVAAEALAAPDLKTLADRLSPGYVFRIAGSP